MRRGLSELRPRHHSVADAADPKRRECGSSARLDSLPSQQLVVGFIGHGQRDLGREGCVPSPDCFAERPLVATRSTLGCWSTRLAYSSRCADNFARLGRWLEIERREDRRPRHVTQSSDSLEQIGLVGENADSLGLGGAGLFGDLARSSGAQPVDSAERRVDISLRTFLQCSRHRSLQASDFHPNLLG